MALMGWLENADLWDSIRRRRFLRTRAVEISFFRQFIQANDLVFDVGANIGDKAMVFRNLGARVVCIEPQPAMCETLARRFLRDSKVLVEPVALGAVPGRATMLMCAEAPEISTLALEGLEIGRFGDRLRDAGESLVEVVPMERLIDKYGLPKFCKIDVEGYELQVLQGLRSRIPIMSLEVNIEFLQAVRECVGLLEMAGRTEFNFSLADSSRLVFAEWRCGNELLSFLEMQSDPDFWGDMYVRNI